MQMESLNELFEHELRDIYSAEKQILKALPKMAKAARTEKLREAFNEHLDVTKQQVERLDQFFANLELKSKNQTCKGMAGLLEEGNDLMKEDLDEKLVDAALIGAAQRVEHYEIAAYGTVCAFAKLLDDQESAELLHTSLEEEADADRKLSELAESVVNVRAANGEDGELDEEDDEDDDEGDGEAVAPRSVKKRASPRS
ncbi:MAG TPA: ferritin-like domain-containing protein [Candidatus Polarisedimenticolaceae bacterium]|nr:ferritin-like domain-containing protein [Candidatus Polarisedimenticolaceae bacterium]